MSYNPQYCWPRERHTEPSVAARATLPEGDAYLQKLPKKPRFFSAAAYSSSEWFLSHH